MNHVKDGLHVDCKDTVEGRLIYIQQGLVAVSGTSIIDYDVRNTKGTDTFVDSGLNVLA